MYAALPSESNARRIAEIGLSVAVCVAVLAFGGTAEFFLVPQFIVLGMGVWVVGAGLRSPRTAIRPSYTVPLLLVVLVLLQLLPFPSSLAFLFGPQRADSSGGYLTLSIAPYQTVSHLLLLITYLTAFFLTLQIGRDRSARERMVLVLICLGTFEALYGLAQYLAGWQHIFTYAKKYYLEDATGTYINRNHFAGFLEMVLPLTVAMALFAARRFARAGPRQGGRVRRLISSAELPRIFFWLFLATLLFTALLFSRSRMGIASAVVSLIAVLALARSSQLSARLRLLIGTLLFVAVAALVIWIGSGAVINRFETVEQEYGQAGQNRMSIWRDTLKLIRRHPLAGSGLGTFAVAYPSVQTAFLNLLVDHAHCDYLEVVTEIGLPGGVLLFGSIFWILVQAVRRCAKADPRSEGAICLGCSGGMIALLLHGFTDFNLYIPANAFIFSILMALAWSAAHAQRNEERQISLEPLARFKKNAPIPSLSV